MALIWPPKDPDEVLDYDLDWSSRLDDGDTIVSSQWLLEAGDLIIDSNAYSASETKVWLSGGALGEAYVLTNRVTTSGGRTMDQSVKLKVKAK